MSGTVFGNTVISALVLAAAYSLVTLGYVVVFRASRVFNFAHPSFMLVGALLYTTLFHGGSGGFALAAVVSILVVSAIGWLLYLAVFHRVAGQPHWIQVILTMGISIVALNVAELVWGTDLRFVKLGFPETTWQLGGGVTLTSTDLAVFVIGVVLSVVAWYALSVSPMSFRLKATAEDPVLAAYCGIRLRFWFGVAWAVASAAAAIGGIAYSTRVPVDATLTDVGLLAFPAALLGGMDSIGGAFLGALVLALVQQFSATLLNSDAATPIAFFIVLIVLLVRPRGFFGSPMVQRV